MFLSKFFSNARAKVMCALAGLTLVFGAGAAISAGVSAVNDNEVVETGASKNFTTSDYIYVDVSGFTDWLNDGATIRAGCLWTWNDNGNTDWKAHSLAGAAGTLQYDNVYKCYFPKYDNAVGAGAVRASSNGDLWNHRFYSDSDISTGKFLTITGYDDNGNIYNSVNVTVREIKSNATGTTLATHTFPVASGVAKETSNFVSKLGSYSGYTFDAFYTTAGGNVKSTSISITTATTIYARYTPNNYAVSISAGTGVSSVYLSSSDSATSGSASGTKFAMDSTVYGFATLSAGYKAPDGWTLVSGTANTAGAKYRIGSRTVATSGATFGSISATAQTYTITVDLDGGSGVSNDTYAFSASAQTKALSAPTKAGKDFAYYTVASQPTSGTVTVTGNTTLNIPANAYGAFTVKAIWSDGLYTIVFDKNGGSVAAPSNMDVGVGTEVTFPTYSGTKTGYNFTGWNTEVDGAGTHYDAGGTGTPSTAKDGELLLYAEWTAATYTVTLTTHGGTINVGNVTSYTYGVGAALPTNVTRAGYNFKGWFTASSGGTQVTSISTTDTGNKTYHAQWSEYTDFWVSFDGGTTKQQLTKVTEASGSELYQLSTASTLTVFGGQSITFYRGATAGAATAYTYAENGLTAESGSTNNVVTTSNTWTVRNYATGVNIYFKVFADASSYTFFLGGKTGEISTATHGVTSGTTFYVQDLLKKNGATSNFGSDGAKLAVYFYDPVGEVNSVHQWSASFCALDSSEGSVDLYSVTVPQFQGHDMKWGGAIVLRFGSDMTVENLEEHGFDWCLMDNGNQNMKNGVNAGHFSDDVQNCIQVQYWWGESRDGGYNVQGNYVMLTDAGLASGTGIYVDTTGVWGNWETEQPSYHIYGYFFSVVAGDGAATAWSEAATVVPGSTHLYELETPQLDGEDVEWAKLIIVYAPAKGSWTDQNKYQTQDLWYSSAIQSHTHITFTGNATGEYKSEATHDASYTDATRAESWGSRFNASITCSGSGSNTATSGKWTTAKNEFDAAPSAARKLIKESTALPTGTQLQKAVSNYDDIIYKYGSASGIISRTYADFISRLGTTNYSGGSGYARFIPNGHNAGEASPLTLTLWIVLGAGLAGLTAIGAAYFISKKRKRA